MEPPQNGYILCKIVDGIHKCTPSCRQGYALSDAPAGGFYTCIEGKWAPVAKPQCMRKYTLVACLLSVENTFTYSLSLPL